jgi:hypothetical protein
LFSLPITLIHSLPIFTSPYYPSPTHHHTIPPSYTLTTPLLAYCTNCTQPSPLQSLTQGPSTTTTEIYPNTHKSHKTQQTPYLFPHPPFPSPLFVPPLPITKVSISSLINIIPQTLTVYRYYHQGFAI